MIKSEVKSWESVASFVSTFPSGDGEGACDVDVQIGSSTVDDPDEVQAALDLRERIAGVSMITPPECQGQIVIRSYGCDSEHIYCHVVDQSDREEMIIAYEHTDSDVEPWNRTPTLGDEVERATYTSEGRPIVAQRTVWFVRTSDDAGGSDDADDTAYETRDEAEAAAEALAEEMDEGDGAPDAEAYLRAADEADAGEPDADGGWCVYWETALDDAGPRERYETQAQAQAAAKIANADLRVHNPGGNLLCGFSVRSLVDGEWVESDSE